MRGVSRLVYTINLEELLNAQECKDGRIVTNEDHAEAVDFIVSYQALKDEPQYGRHQRWLPNPCVVDYVGSQKLMRKKKQSGRQITSAQYVNNATSVLTNELR